MPIEHSHEAAETVDELVYDSVELEAPRRHAARVSFKTRQGERLEVRGVLIGTSERSCTLDIAASRHLQMNQKLRVSVEDREVQAFVSWIIPRPNGRVRVGCLYLL